MTIEYLREKLNQKRSRVRTRYNYYEMHNHVDMYRSILPDELKGLSSSLGWCTKAVDSLADRLSVYGFKNDVLNLQEIYNMNNPDILFDSAMLSALIGSCSFIYISQGEDFPRMQVIDGYDATGVIDPITNMLQEGYAVLEKDENGHTIVDAYFEPGKTTYFYHNEREVFEVDNPCEYPLLVPIINRPDYKRPFGHSRITRACMSYTKFAIRNILLSAVSSEFYAFPQKWVKNLDPDIDFNGHKASMTDFLALTQSSEGAEPVFGQFQSSSMTPYMDMMRMYASLFAGETGLTVDDLGFVQDNPSSAEAIKASHENLRLYARKCQKAFGTGFINAGFLARQVADGTTLKRNALYRTSVLYDPLFEPDMSMLGAIGDGALKLNQAIPNYIGNENMRALTGIEGNND